MWQTWLKKPLLTKKKCASEPTRSRQKSAPVKLSYTLQREFDGMEQAIAGAEVEVERSESIASDENVMADHQKHSKACAEVASAHEKVRELYARWAELEGMQ